MIRYDVPMNSNSETFAPVDVDNIYVSTRSPWFFLSPVMEDEEGNISEFTVEDLEDGSKHIVKGNNLYRAAKAILNGKHVGKAMTAQIVRDFADWREAPEYGVPFDSEMSDLIIQIAVHGEVLYG